MYVWSAMTRFVVSIVILICGVAVQNIMLKCISIIILCTFAIDLVASLMKKIIEENE